MIGHSLGGKIVLEYVKQMSQQSELELPRQVWIIMQQVDAADFKFLIAQSKGLLSPQRV